MSANREKSSASDASVEKKHDSIVLRVTNGRKALLQAHASAQGESLNAFINRAVDNQLLRDDNTKKKRQH